MHMREDNQAVFEIGISLLLDCGNSANLSAGSPWDHCGGLYSCGRLLMELLMKVKRVGASSPSVLNHVWCGNDHATYGWRAICVVRELVSGELHRPRGTPVIRVNYLPNGRCKTAVRWTSFKRVDSNNVIDKQEWCFKMNNFKYIVIIWQK